MRLSVSDRRGWLSCGLAALCFGVATPVTKLVVEDVGPFVLAGLLYLGAALAVGPLRFRERRLAQAGRQRMRLILTVVVGGGVAPVLLMLGLGRTSASTVSLLLNFELIATVCVARVFFKEQIGRRPVFGIAIVLAGGLVLAGFAGSGLDGGVLFVVGACMCWGIDNAITASLDGYSPVAVTFAKGLVAGTANLTIGLMLERVPSFTAILAVLAIGSIGYGVSITLWISGARFVGAARGQVIFALAPFVGALLAWPLVGEQPTARVAIAFTLTLAGVLIVATATHEHAHSHDTIVHAHSYDDDDLHHLPDAIALMGDGAHRHYALSHAHSHLPDIHHRHAH